LQRAGFSFPLFQSAFFPARTKNLRNTPIFQIPNAIRDPGRLVALRVLARESRVFQRPHLCHELPHVTRPNRSPPRTAPARHGHRGALQLPEYERLWPASSFVSIVRLEIHVLPAADHFISGFEHFDVDLLLDTRIRTRPESPMSIRRPINGC
jgi:hypothetical protein